MPGVPLYFYYKKKKSQGMKNKEKKIHLFDQELSTVTVRLELCLDESKGTLHYIRFMTFLLKSNNMGLTLSFAFSTM